MKGNFGGNGTSFESFIKPILSGLIVGLIVIALLFILFAFGMSFYNRLSFSSDWNIFRRIYCG